MPAAIIGPNDRIYAVTNTVHNGKRVVSEVYLNPVTGVRLCEISSEAWLKIEKIIQEELEK